MKFVILIFLIPLSLSSALITVNLDGTGNYASVNEAMDASIAGDSLLVYPGIYYENIHLYKEITLMSLYGISGEESYIDSTILDGNSITSVLATTQNNSDFFAVVITGFTIQNGFARSLHDEHALGGGIYAFGIDITINHCKVINNRAFIGGGICLFCTTASLSANEITGNTAVTDAGGIFIHNTECDFSETELNSIYLNYCGKTNDIAYSNVDGLVLDITLALFTVSQYNSYFVKSFQNPPIEDPQFINLTVIDHLIDPISEDIYVSPDGDNENSGLSADQPLQTVSYALAMYDGSSPETHTLHVSDGYYGISANNEKLPWHLHSNLVIEGESEENTVISTEGYPCHLVCTESISFNIVIRNMTLLGGNLHPNIWINDADGLTLENITISELSWIGNVINLAMCNAVLRDLKIYDVIGTCPIFLTHYSDQYMLLENVDISGVYQNQNELYPSDMACGIGTMSDTAFEYARFDLINCKFVDIYTENSTYPVLCATGCDFSLFSDVNMINCVVSNTRTNDETDPAIYVMDSRLNLVNCIVYDVDNRALFMDYYDMMLPEITVDHSLVQGGEAGVGGYWGSLNWLEGNLDCDPMFDMSMPDRYSLSEGSPCIDAGTLDLPEGIELPEYDLAGNPRISGDMIDMGPYEWQYPDAIDNNEIYALNQDIIVYPNPIIPGKMRDGRAWIEWSGEDVSGDVSFEIFNIKGQRIRSFKIQNSSRNNRDKITPASWDLCDEAGNTVSSGVYFLRISKDGEYIEQRKLTVIK